MPSAFEPVALNIERVHLPCYDLYIKTNAHHSLSSAEFTSAELRIIADDMDRRAQRLPANQPPSPGPDQSR